MTAGVKRVSQSGGALIIAILVVALVTTSAVLLVRGQSLFAGQATQSLESAQARLLLRAGLDWSLTLLADDGRNTSIDHAGEAWARQMPPTETDGWEITGRIEDAQSRFNLNNLVRDGRASPGEVEVFVRILARVGAAPQLAAALIDWLDADSETTQPGGGEDEAYLSANPPLRVANRPLVAVDELTRVRGFDRSLIEKLRPFVTVLPEPTPVNVNTAPAPLLALLVPGLSPGEAEALARARMATPWHTMAEFRASLPRSELKWLDGSLSLGTRYFLVTGEARAGSKRAGMAGLVVRPSPYVKPSLVWRREL